MSSSWHNASDHAKVGMSINQGVLLIPVQVELYDDVLLALQDDALQLIQQRNLKRMLLDLSQLHIMDEHIAQALVKLVKMAELLGATSVVTGIQPGVAIALLDWTHIWQEMNTALTLDAGLSMLSKHA